MQPGLSDLRSEPIAVVSSITASELLSRPLLRGLELLRTQKQSY